MLIEPDCANLTTVLGSILKVAPSGDVDEEGGNLKDGESASTGAVVDETYYNSYVAHSPMEPHTAVAVMEGDKIKIWASTQSPFGLQSSVSRTLNMPIENVHVMTPYVGGGFGGKNGQGSGRICPEPR